MSARLGSGLSDPTLLERAAQLRTLPRSAAPETRERTFPLLAPLHPASPPEEVRRDVAYGPDPQHLLDLHLPSTEHAAPIFVFVHGGGFVGGDKGGPGRPFYDNIGRFAALAGMLGVSMTYRLAPQATYPAGAEDVATACAFLGSVAADYHADPERIVVMGHSAGAAHVASFAASEKLASSVPGLRGVVLSSGVYAPGRLGLGAHPYYGDLATAQDYSALDGLAASALPVLLTVAEYDAPAFHEQALELAGALLAARGALPRLLVVPGHNHFSTTWHLGTAEEWLAEAILRFVADVVAD